MNLLSKSPQFIQGFKPQQPPPKKSKKINTQLFWQIIFVFISVISAILFNKIYIYQRSQQFQSIRKGNIYELLFFGIPCGIIFIYLQNLFHQYLDKKIELQFISFQKYPIEENRKKRCYKIVKWIFSLVYYGFMSLFAYQIIKNTSFMPKWLGGNGYCTDLSRYIYSLDQSTIGMKIFYIIQFGKHMGRFIHHCFVQVQGNFYEYALHHGLSTFLIFFSYLMNMWLIGIFVLLIHDISDIFLILSRGYRDCRTINKHLLLGLDVGGFMIWIFCRIFLLSFCCVYSSLSTAYEFWKNEQVHNSKIYEVLIIPGAFMGFMLLSLLILQFFWTYHILCSIVVVSLKKNILKTSYE